MRLESQMLIKSWWIMNKIRCCFVGLPNVGKSSLYNYLTHSMEHTGNWTGKTVSEAKKTFQYQSKLWEVVDLPGTYSLIGESEEEKITSHYVLYEKYDLAIVVADATNLERSIDLILEVLDVTPNVIVLLNLIDEARKRKILVRGDLLSKKIHVPVIETSLKTKEGLPLLLEEMRTFKAKKRYQIKHNKRISYALKKTGLKSPLYLLERRTKEERLYASLISPLEIAKSYHKNSVCVLKNVYSRVNEKEKKEDIVLNHILTNPFMGSITMIGLLIFILWLTIYFSNIPSDWLFSLFQYLEPILYRGFSILPVSICNSLIYGGYRTLYWVVSVMLPPMMIFFPLFSLLEDYGVLPRIAFNLDDAFASCGSCGKQSLTMCMGLGCNAVGVTGTRIMENKKMRILSILTNVFMPCNGRFPAMIAVISMFFTKKDTAFSSLISALLLTGIILLGIFLTFLVTKILSKFLFKKEEPIFILELPSFRKPNILGSIKTSIKEKALDVLKRAMIVSFPAGILIYILANTYISGSSILVYLETILNPFGLLIGVDGVIMLSFILGLPANEIVIPILLLCYSKGNMLSQASSLELLKLVLIQNGWTMKVAFSFLILSLCHFPCATTLMTIKKETNSWFYLFLSILIPCVIGLFLCYIFHCI